MVCRGSIDVKKALDSPSIPSNRALPRSQLLCGRSGNRGLHIYIGSLSIEGRRNGQSIWIKLGYNVERRVDLQYPGEIRLLFV